MSKIDLDHSDKSYYVTQIEAYLGRALTAHELTPAGSLAEISADQRHVAKTLARRQLVICALYLRAIARASVAESSRFIDDLLGEAA